MTHRRRGMFQFWQVMKYFAVAFIFAGIAFLGCDAQVRSNIERLESARDRLIANPEDEEALAMMLRLLEDRNGINRSNAAVLIGQAGEKVGGSIKGRALPPLLKMLDEGDGADKRTAAIGIRGFGVHAAEAVPDLLRVIGENLSEDPGSYQVSIRQSATRAIGRIGPAAAGAKTELTRYLSESRIPRFRVEVAVALISIDPGNRDGFAAIRGFLQDRDVEIRRETIWELEEAGPAARPAIGLMESAQKDNDPDVRAGATQMLRALRGS